MIIIISSEGKEEKDKAIIPKGEERKVKMVLVVDHHLCLDRSCPRLRPATIGVRTLVKYGNGRPMVVRLRISDAEINQHAYRNTLSMALCTLALTKVLGPRS